jgi:hypothetical protein
MEVIVFSGGLGNQLFQYAFYLAKQRSSVDLCINTYSIRREGKHNGLELEKLFGIHVDSYESWRVRLVRKLLIFQKKKYFQTISTLLLHIIKCTGVQIVQEKGYSVFNSGYLQSRKGFVLYFGFWQSPLYFDAVQNEIRRLFSFGKLPLSGKTQTLLTRIQAQESISIHIRRGDFLSSETQNVYAGICDKAYYAKAIARINEQTEHPFFVVFSDDPEWVKADFPLSNAVYVDWNCGENSWQDMYLMSQCKHNIIANSTFSWWGAWLNEYSEKLVIAPVRFVNNAKTPDIYPGNWMLIGE